MVDLQDDPRATRRKLSSLDNGPSLKLLNLVTKVEIMNDDNNNAKKDIGLILKHSPS